MTFREDGTIPHGAGGYSRYKCRCDTCRSAWADYIREWLRVRIHGIGGYSHGCRCDICRSARNDYQNQRRALARKKQVQR